MAQIKWDQTGERFFETGVKKGVLYVLSGAAYGKGVAWNGLSKISESPEGAELSSIYADDIKYLNLRSAENFKATIECYTYPDEFAACNGEAELGEGTGITITQQTRSTFAFSYVTTIGNDLNSELGYKIHIVYGATCAPSSRDHETINDSPAAMTMSFEVSTVPVEVTGMKPTAHIVIDSTKVSKENLAKIEDALYGTTTEEPKVLLPDEILALIK